MFNGHLIKVILGFCGVIIIGLISLVFIDSFKERDEKDIVQSPIVETQASTQTTTNTKSINKTTTKKATPTTKSPTNKTP